MMMMKKVYYSVKWEVFYNILLGFGTPVNLVRLIKLCLIKTYSTVRVGKHWSDVFPIRNGLKKRDALSPLLFDLVFGYAIRWVQVSQGGLRLTGTHQLLVYADDVNIMCTCYK
jgi:hypothetical protein